MRRTFDCSAAAQQTLNTKSTKDDKKYENHYQNSVIWGGDTISVMFQCCIFSLTNRNLFRRKFVEQTVEEETCHSFLLQFCRKLPHKQTSNQCSGEQLDHAVKIFCPSFEKSKKVLEKF